MRLLVPFGANEGVLKLSARTRHNEEFQSLAAGAPKTLAAIDLPFKVRDQRLAPINAQMDFRHVLFVNSLDLGIDLMELDRGAHKDYQKIKNAIDPPSRGQLLDIFAGIPYVQLASRIANGLIEAFGDNNKDQVWHARPTFAIDPLLGGPFLRTGLYVAYENDARDLSASQLTYVDGLLYTQDGRRLKEKPSHALDEDRGGGQFVGVPVKLPDADAQVGTTGKVQAVGEPVQVL